MATGKTMTRLGAWVASIPAWFRAEPHRLLVALLLFVGFLLRLWFLPDARFTGDESFFFQESTLAAWGENLPWRGPPVTGGPLHHPGGTFYLLMAIPLVLVSSPLACMALVAALNTLAYGLLYATVGRLMGRRVGIVFLLLLVFSPWSFFYSDRIWNSNIVLVLTALFFWGLVGALQTRRALRIFWATFALVVFPQFHLSVPLLVAVAVVLLALYRPRLHLWATLGGIGAALLTYIPYAAHELGHDFSNTRLFFDRVGGEAVGSVEAVRGLLGFFLLPTNEVSYFVERGFWFRHDTWAYYADGPGLGGMTAFFGGGVGGTLLTAAMVASVVAATLGIVALVGVLVTDRERRRALLRENPLVPAFGVALAVIPLVFLFSKKGYFPHYIYPLYPLAFVPLLVLVWRFRARRALYALCVGAALLHAVAGVAVSGTYYKEVDAKFSVRTASEVVHAIYDTARDRTCHISYDIERSRLSPFPLLRLARWGYQRPIHLDDRADLRYRIFSPTRYAAFRELPSRRQRIRGLPVTGERHLTHVVLMWGERGAPPLTSADDVGTPRDRREGRTPPGR